MIAWIGLLYPARASLDQLSPDPKTPKCRHNMQIVEQDAPLSLVGGIHACKACALAIHLRHHNVQQLGVKVVMMMMMMMMMIIIIINTIVTANTAKPLSPHAPPICNNPVRQVLGRQHMRVCVPPADGMHLHKQLYILLPLLQLLWFAVGSCSSVGASFVQYRIGGAKDDTVGHMWQGL